MAVTAAMTVALSVAGNKSSIADNPLLANNIEALSTTEMEVPTVVEASDGTIYIYNAKNIKNEKGRPVNQCEYSKGAVCTLSAGYNANGRMNWFQHIKSLLSSFRWSDLFAFLSDALSKF